METLLELFVQFQNYSKANPIISGAVALYGVGIVTFISRNIPAKIVGFIKRQFTTTLVFTNQNIGSNLQNFTSFMKWFDKHNIKRLSRTMMFDADSCYGHEVTLGLGMGRHYCIYKRKLFWVDRVQMANAQGTSQINYQVTITTLGRNQNLLRSMFDDFKYSPPPSTCGVYTIGRDGWKYITSVDHRNLDTVVINHELKATILSIIDKFKAGRQWFIDRGLPYKKTFIFHGEPGTGKTSLIKGLASHYSMNLCVLDAATVSGEGFSNALVTAPSNSIIVMEDFDSINSSHDRALKDTKSPSILNDLDHEMSRISLSNILNGLDGIMSLDNKLIIITSNHLDAFDPALVRKGRVDHIFEIGKLHHAEIMEYIGLMFPNDTLPSVKFADILGCDLQALYFDHKDNFNDFVNSIPTVQSLSIKLIVND